ncbi:MAG TPA: uracil-DNA glycosylase [Williamwhitmania sp.]|nr:uracil-DNA glycosylase [Williamwhitmania sp.]
MTKQARLLELERGWLNCTRCPLYKCNTPSEQNPSGRAFGRGNPDAPLLLVGEALGKTESISGNVFDERAPAGGKLKQILSYYELEGLVYIANPVACQSTKNGKNVKPNASQYAACRHRFDQLIQIIQPKLIVAMGAGAAEVLTGQSIQIMKQMGEMFQVGHGTVVVVPHPASYLYRKNDEELRKNSHRIWKKISKIAKSGLTSSMEG